jgi:APA family basic amino acid/polyamine antiporter
MADNLGKSPDGSSTGLARQMTLLGLVATGICSMIGAGVNVIPIMIQRNVPGIGPNVLPAYFVAMVPAMLAALAYAILASGMPRAGGSYVYASRSTHAYLGFVASFSQWFGLAMAMGVVAYVLVPFLRDIAVSVNLSRLASILEWGPVRVTLALGFLWAATFVNLIGIKTYERAMVVLMFLMFVGGAVVIPAGFYFNHADFAAAIAAREGVTVAATAPTPLNAYLLFAGTAVLFSSFIGFDTIAQAGGEAKNPNRTLPIATGISVVIVGTFYMLFTGAVYHAVPWYFIAERGATTDLTAPGLLGYLLPPVWTVIIVAGSAVALFNSLPTMVLGISRLMFAWGEDGIFVRAVAAVHPRWRTPHVAILISAFAATGSIIGCHLAGDFFLGVDLLVIGMLVNFIVMCISVLTLPWRNPKLAAGLRFMKSRVAHWVVGLGGASTLGVLLVAQIIKDLRADVPGWYYRSTWNYLLMMSIATAIFIIQWRKLRRAGVDLEKLYSNLPPE